MEEDIKILEKLSSIYQELKKDFEEGHASSYEMQFEDFTAIENLLKRYKELEEENKTYIAQLNGAFDRGFIPISVIQNKITPVIDELEKDGFVGYADELRDIVQEILEKGNK